MAIQQMLLGGGPPVLKQYYHSKVADTISQVDDWTTQTSLWENLTHMGCGWGFSGYNCDFATFKIHGSGSFELTHIGFGMRCNSNSGTSNIRAMSSVVIDGDSSAGTVIYRDFKNWDIGSDTSGNHSFRFHAQDQTPDVGSLPITLNRGSWYTVGWHYTSASGWSYSSHGNAPGSESFTKSFTHNGATINIEWKNTSFNSGGYGNTANSNGTGGRSGQVQGIGFKI
jgi:hypothetical protein